MSDFYGDSARRRLEMIEAERASALADLASHRANGDHDSASYSIQQLANLAAEQRNLGQLYNEYVAANQAPRQPYVSQESRQARSPSEMDAQDCADVMNQSRYSKLGTGRSFSAQDYYHLRSGLGPYNAARGREQK